MLKERAKSSSSEVKEEALLKKAIGDEAEGIKMYEKLISLCDEPEKRKVYQSILSDEKRHHEMLKKIKK